MSIQIGHYLTNQAAAGSQIPGRNQAMGKSQMFGKNQAAGNQAMFGNSIRSGTKNAYNERMMKMKQMLRGAAGQANNAQNPWGPNSIIQDSLNYSDTIRASREKAKKMALEKKKVQYSYKSISNKILSSKTSVGARQAASQARREVTKLEKKRGSDDYDQEELEAAITHAKAMERLAKKKARHLEEEEMAKVSGGFCAGGIEEKEEMREETPEEEEDFSKLPEEEIDPEAFSEYDYEAEEIDPEEFSDAMIDSMSLAQMEAFVNDMQETMEEVMEETGLNDLFEELTASSGEEMDPADYKMMKIKHRCKELKDLAKADADYLKVIFKKMEESKGKAIEGMKGMGSSGGAGMSFGAPSAGAVQAAVHIDIPVSDGGGDAPAGDAVIDVSI